jgi:acetylornithine/succinyldiaminopimelate/putrescine aminotransferase
MPGSIQASTACDPVIGSALAATFEQMIREQIPNLLRLFVNPHVAQACYCLTRLVAEAWPESAHADDYQVFLANSGEEALSGAIKLARYASNAAGGSSSGVILDEDDRCEHFAFTDLPGLGRVEFIPGVEVVRDPHELARRLSDPAKPVGFVVVSLASLRSDRVVWESVPNDERRPLRIAVATQNDFATQHQFASRESVLAGAPDIVIFDESFVNHEVPFGAFAATKRLYQHWTRRGMTTFHSTTYQPNTISTLHLMNCLRESLAGFLSRHQTELQRIADDPRVRYQQFRHLYSPSLAKLSSIVGADGDVRAAGHYVTLAGRRIFDGVAGVACSVRGHNPRSFVEEMQLTGDLDACREELTERLADLTGLPHMIPAVSGAAAVEHALKLGLTSQFPRDYVLALRGGFGGKTLFALTGTWKSSLKSGLTPLYPNVVYVDPFAADATAAIESAFREHSIGVVQLELIQGVGGVRAIPSAVLQCLAEQRRQHDCLLFVDEVQTGMFRTGPFVRSRLLGLQPDLLTIGKGTSDMMFPFALTLFSDAVQQRLAERRCSLPDAIRSRYEYETGLITVLNTLRRADAVNLAAQVGERSELFACVLDEELRDCPLVREVRCFGLLIGIELDADRWPHRWLKKLIYQLYLLAMLRHRPFPLLVGFCQYEPNILKLTPPLSITEDEVRSVCRTISTVLRQPLIRVAASGLMQMCFRRGTD